MDKIVIAIDPGTGRTSPTGFVAFDPDLRMILHHQRVTSTHKDTRHRIKDIFEQVSTAISAIDPDLEANVFCESFVMRGKGGETLARLTGAFMVAVPYEISFEFVQNTTVKRIVGGSGKADKAAVAKGVYLWFENAPLETRAKIEQLIEDEEWDVLDALAIGIAGWERRCE